MPNKIDFQPTIDFEPIDFEPISQPEDNSNSYQLMGKWLSGLSQGAIEGAKNLIPSSIDTVKEAGKSIYGLATGDISGNLERAKNFYGGLYETGKNLAGLSGAEASGKTAGSLLAGAAIPLGTGKLLGAASRFASERTMLAPSTAANAIATGLEVKNTSMLGNIRTLLPYVDKISRLTENPITSVKSLEGNLVNLRSALWDQIEPMYDHIANQKVKIGSSVREALGKDISNLTMEQKPQVGRTIEKMSKPYENRDVTVGEIVAKIKENNIALEGLYDKFQRSWNAVKADSNGALLLKENELLKGVVDTKAAESGIGSLRDLNKLYGKTKELLEFVSDKSNQYETAKTIAAGYRYPNVRRVGQGLKGLISLTSPRRAAGEMIGAGITRINTPDNLIRHAFDVMQRIDSGGPLFEKGISAANFPPEE